MCAQRVVSHRWRRSACGRGGTVVRHSDIVRASLFGHRRSGDEATGELAFVVVYVLIRAQVPLRDSIGRPDNLAESLDIGPTLLLTFPIVPMFTCSWQALSTRRQMSASTLKGN